MLRYFENFIKFSSKSQKNYKNSSKLKKNLKIKTYKKVASLSSFKLASLEFQWSAIFHTKHGNLWWKKQKKKVFLKEEKNGEVRFCRCEKLFILCVKLNWKISWKMRKNLSHLFVSYIASNFQRFHLFFLQKRGNLGHKNARKCVLF